MGKKSLVFNCLSIVLLISVVFLSIDQQVLPTIEQTMIKADSEAPAVTYPYLDFSTYLGGSDGVEDGFGIAVSRDGSYYVMGRTDSNDFPTLNAFDDTYNDGRDTFVAKFSDSGSLLWCTYLGGNDFDGGFSIAVAFDGSCYIMGTTRSDDFPTLNAYNSTSSGKDDIFLTKFSTNGALLWSTYLGGSDNDYGFDIAVARDGSCYVTGETQSNDFPIKNAYSNTFNGGNFDAFVTKFSSYGNLLWSSYLGGDWNDAGKAVAVSRDGSCFVTGRTWSSDFPTLNSYDSTLNGYWDVFVTQFSSKGILLWSTYLGGDDWDEGLGIDIARDGSCYITGFARSIGFPTLNAFDDSLDFGGDAFVSKFASNGSLLWSTYLGGNGIERSYGIAVVSDGRCYVTGETFSTNFPIKFFNSTLSGQYDAFVTCFSSEGFLLWSTYHGGSDFDYGFGIAVTDDVGCYIVGTTSSPDFPTQNAFDDTLGDSHDAFIVKFVDTPVPPQPINGFLVFVAVAPAIAFLMVIGIILFKKRK
ncbi:MAG: SBBP repeat-containing protein [Candidatus Heimdallarchaeota archaeon]